MRENRTEFPKRKVELYQQLQELPQKYNIIGLVHIEKVRASQLLPLRKKFKDEVEIVSIKNKVAKKALDTVNVPELKKFAERLTGQCVLMFTHMSPFKLNVLLKKNKVMMAARAGDIASTDVVIKAKNTGIAPGPVLTSFKEANIPTKIDQGTIWITKDTTVAKKGEVINDKLATILSKLDVKPVEAGVTLDSALEEGTIFEREDLTVDPEQYKEYFSQAHKDAISLTLSIGYITPENSTTLLAKAAQEARTLSVESGYITDETKELILQRAYMGAKSVADKAKDYTPKE